MRQSMAQPDSCSRDQGWPVRLDRGQIEVVDEEMARVYRRMTGAERLAVASGLFASARRMLISHLRAEHPDWNEQQVNQETARRLSHGAL